MTLTRVVVLLLGKITNKMGRSVTVSVLLVTTINSEKERCHSFFDGLENGCEGSGAAHCQEGCDAENEWDHGG